MSWVDEMKFYTNASDLTVDSIISIKQALRDNPTESEARDLNGQLVELQLKKTLLDERLSAIVGSRNSVRPPSASELERVKNLTYLIEAQTNSATMVSDSIILAGKVVDLITEVSA
jgi:hypothetical protein